MVWRDRSETLGVVRAIPRLVKPEPLRVQLGPRTAVPFLRVVVGFVNEPKTTWSNSTRKGRMAMSQNVTGDVRGRGGSFDGGRG
jgi:hypothetical protein